MAKDVNYGKRVLLLPMTGSNNSTVFTDLSKSPKTITVLGDAKISTAVNDPFGGSTGVGYFDGSVDGLVFPNTSEFAFGKGDSTIESFMYRLGANAAYSRIYNPDGDYYNGVTVAVDPSWYLATFGTATDNTYDLWSNPNPVYIPLNQWVHWALVRYGRFVTLYVGGAAYPIVTLANEDVTLFQSTQSNLCVGGQHGADRSFNGYLAQYRVSNFAQYTKPFTPPTAPFGDTAYNVNCQLSESLTASNFLMRVHELATGELTNSLTVTAGTFGVDPMTSEPVTITVMPVQGDVWKPSHSYAIDDLVFPTNPATTPYYYKRLAASSSGSTEPTWTTTIGGQCDDGVVSNAWECVSGLTDPKALGMFIPS